MTSIEFVFEQKLTIQTVVIDGEPWFVGKDVAEILGYTNPPKAIRDHVDDFDKLTEQIVRSGQNRNVILINESGLYTLIVLSKLPQAKPFKRWITAEVLPSIRKTGRYHDKNNSFDNLCPIDIKNSIKRSMGKYIKRSGYDPTLAYYIKYTEFGNSIGVDFYSEAKKQGIRPIDWLKDNGHYEAFGEFLN